MSHDEVLRAVRNLQTVLRTTPRNAAESVLLGQLAMFMLTVERHALYSEPRTAIHHIDGDPLNNRLSNLRMVEV